MWKKLIYLWYFLCIINKFAHTSQLNSHLVRNYIDQDVSRIIFVLHCTYDFDELSNIHKATKSVTFIAINDDIDRENINAIKNQHNSLIIFDMNCKNSKNVLELSSKDNLFNKRHTWLLFGTVSLNNSLEVVINLSLNIDSRVLLVINESNNYDIYRIICPALTRNTIMHVEMVGNYTKAKNFQYQNPFNKVNYSLEGTVIRVASSIPEIPPKTSFLEFLTKKIVSNKFGITRYPMQIIMLISELYNFRLHIIRSGLFGSLIPNTTQWSGVVGMLQRNEVDIGGHSIAFTTVRLKFLENGFSIVKYRQSFIFRHPKYDTGKRNVFLMPLSQNVWWTILTTAILMIILLCIISFYERIHGKIYDVITISIINVVALLSQQGLSTDNLRSMKGKLVIICFLLLSFVCFQFYSASIVGSLLAPTPRTITTIEKLTKSGMKIIMEEHPSSHLIFRVITDEDVLGLYEARIKGKEEFYTAKDGLQKIRSERCAMLIYVDDVADIIKSTLTASELEELQVIPILPQDHRSLLALPYAKNSPFSELFRVGTLKIIENGLKDYHWRRWIVNLNEKSHKNSFDTAVVDFKRTSAIFYMLFIGYLISFVILILEMCILEYWKRKSMIRVIMLN